MKDEIFGSAVDLDGTNGYAVPAGVVSSADTITVAAWVNLDTAFNEVLQKAA